MYRGESCCILAIGVNRNPSKAPNRTEIRVKGKSLVGEIPGIPTAGTIICCFDLPTFSFFQFNHYLNPLLHSTLDYNSFIITHFRIQIQTQTPTHGTLFLLTILQSSYDSYRFAFQASTLRLYLTCIRNTLEAAMCLQVLLLLFNATLSPSVYKYISIFFSITFFLLFFATLLELSLSRSRKA